MADTARQWQTTVKVGKKNPAFDPQAGYQRRLSETPRESEWLVDDNKTFYGDSFSSLRQSMREWLTENKPTYFATETATCFYSDGTQTVDEYSEKQRAEGWYVRISGVVRGRRPGSFESALEAFLTEGVYTEKGPDHQDTPIIDGKLQLHLIRTIRREREESRANQYLARGWYIISIDHVAEVDSQSIYSWYVLGHPEADAS